MLPTCLTPNPLVRSCSARPRITPIRSCSTSDSLAASQRGDPARRGQSFPPHQCAASTDRVQCLARPYSLFHQEAVCVCMLMGKRLSDQAAADLVRMCINVGLVVQGARAGRGDWGVQSVMCRYHDWNPSAHLALPRSNGTGGTPHSLDASPLPGPPPFPPCLPASLDYPFLHAPLLVLLLAVCTPPSASSCCAQPSLVCPSLCADVPRLPLAVCTGSQLDPPATFSRLVPSSYTLYPLPLSSALSSLLYPLPLCCLFSFCFPPTPSFSVSRMHCFFTPFLSS